MKFLSKLFGRQAEAVKETTPAEPDSAVAPDMAAIMESVQAQTNTANPDVNIWDLENEGDDAAAAPMASRRRRNATRLIGFDNSEGEVVDLFESSEEEADDKSAFPVGWLVVIEGEGRGEYFPIVAGLNQIGRGEDNAVRLDFGDNSISRSNHAMIDFDEEDNSFVLRISDKKKAVRLNEKKVPSNVSKKALNDGDRIELGETTLLLKALCGPEFNWISEGEDEEHDNVAIA